MVRHSFAHNIVRWENIPVLRGMPLPSLPIEDHPDPLPHIHTTDANILFTPTTATSMGIWRSVPAQSCRQRVPVMRYGNHGGCPERITRLHPFPQPPMAALAPPWLGARVRIGQDLQCTAP